MNDQFVNQQTQLRNNQNFSNPQIQNSQYPNSTAQNQNNIAQQQAVYPNGNTFQGYQQIPNAAPPQYDETALPVGDLVEGPAEDKFPIKMWAITGILIVISLIINCIVAMITGNWYFAPFKGDELNIWPLSFIIGVPILIGLSLYYFRVKGTRIIDYILKKK